MIFLLYSHLLDAYLLSLSSPPYLYGQQYLDLNSCRNLSVGEEIFTSYGEDDWFTARGIELKSENEHGKFEDKSNNRYDLDELTNGAYPCLTDVFVDESNVPGAGNFD